MTDFPQLPPGFRFGTSTSAYQIEGAADEGGRGPSIWDTFSAQQGRVIDGSSGEVACDHYHRFDEDIALMKALGTKDYRLSLSWSRIQPTGRGPANEEGLAFYDRLIDALLEAGIAPMVTLYHWDLPQALEDDGGWLNRDTVDRFAEYAAIVAERYADRVAHWIPINEPNVVSFLGYAVGMHAPGRTLMFDSLWVSHHLLLAHGRAVTELRRHGATERRLRQQPRPGLAGVRRRRRRRCEQALRRPVERDVPRADAARSLPRRPDAAARRAAEPGDMATIRQPLDFYGVNYYNPMRVAAAGPRTRRCPSSSATSSATRTPTAAGRWCPTRCASG